MLPLAVAVGGLVIIGAVWFGAQTQVRFALWQSVAERPLTPREGERLGRCDRKPGWWTWVKVLHNDRPVPCGEGWAIDRMADKIGRSADRRRWVRQYVEAADTPPARRLRATLLLNVVGEATPDEPAWLAESPEAAFTPDQGPEQSQAEAWPWAIHLGPRVSALGTMRGMSVAGFAAAEAIGPFEALWALDDPTIDTALVQHAADGLRMPVSISEDRWYRRQQGRPAIPFPPSWTRLLLGRAATCQSTPPSEACLTLWRDLLELQATADGGDEPFEYPPSPSALTDILPVLEPAGRRTRAVEWWLETAEDWIRAAPEPSRRLASLARRRDQTQTPERAHPLAVVDDRTGTPFMTAAVVGELGRRTGIPVEVRVGDDATVWVIVASHVASRARCDATVARDSPDPSGEGAAEPSPGPETLPWSIASVNAGALLEAASQADDPLVGVRLRSAARALDPGLIEPPTLLGAEAAALAATNVQIGFEIGRRLLSANLRVDGATGPRSAIGAQIGGSCG